MLCYLQTEEKSAYIKSTKRFVWERPFFVITVCVQCLIVLWLSIVVLRYINPYINRCSQIKIKKHGESWVGSHKKEKRCFIEPNKVMANKLVDNAVRLVRTQVCTKYFCGKQRKTRRLMIKGSEFFRFNGKLCESSGFYGFAY